MEWHDLDELREPRDYPAVSILVPLQRHRPGNPEDPIRIRHLVDRARQRLREELGDRASAALVRSLEDAVAAIDLANPTEGVAVFVAPGEARTLTLPFPVAERVQIDHTFATRDLVRGLLRTTRYRLLALGEKPTRLFVGAGTTLTESCNRGFPIFVEGARGEPLASGSFPVHTSRSDEQHRAFFRQVDRTLAGVAADDPLPLVLAGTSRALAYFDEITTHARWIIGRVDGNHEATSAEELANLVGPLVEAHDASRRAEVIAELDEAVGSGRVVVGVEAVGEATLAGRTRVLLAEEDFSYPARIVDRRLEPAGDPDAPGVIDDVVDELLEQALDLSGDVVIVGSGELGDHGPIAALLRY
jgi:hypothetical protein